MARCFLFLPLYHYHFNLAIALSTIFMISCLSIQNLPGISTLDIKNLQSVGINTNLDLLKFAINREKQEELALKIGVNIKNILKWTALADLSKIQSIGDKYCGLILHSGIISSHELSLISASKLQQKILKLQVATLQRKDLCPPLSLVQTWIKEAKSIDNNR